MFPRLLPAASARRSPASVTLLPNPMASMAPPSRAA